MVRTSSVLAVPGRPVIRQWPPTNSAISTCSSTSSWPTITRRTCSTIEVSTCWKRSDALLQFEVSVVMSGWIGHWLSSSNSFCAGL